MTDKAAYVFLGPSNMYMIHAVGSNVGCEGITIDHYVTKRMVQKHLRSKSYDVDRSEFMEKYDLLFNSIRAKIIGF